MLIGYARVSTDDQNHDPQLAALGTAGCSRIYRDTISGAKRERPELDRMLDQLRPDDVVVIWKLDRLSRSLGNLLSILEKISEHGAKFRSLTENLDTATPAGLAMMQMIGVFAEFERGIMKERVRAGLDAAKRAGRVGGRRFNGERFKLTVAQQNKIIADVSTGRETVASCARLFGVHPSTIWRLMQRGGKPA